MFRRENTRKNYKNKNIRLKKKTKFNKNSKKLLSITLLIVMIVSLGITYSMAELSSLDKEYVALEREISELKKTKLSLVGKIKGIKSSSEIEEEAMYKLGMVYPKEKQIVYLDLSEEKKEKDVNQNVFLSPIISVLKSFTKD